MARLVFGGGEGAVVEVAIVVVVEIVVVMVMMKVLLDFYCSGSLRSSSCCIGFW